MRTENVKRASTSVVDDFTDPAISTRPQVVPGPKPVSAKKLAANRANARGSTGPRTPAGKARAAMNAVRHGLAARASLLPGEDPEELMTLASELESDLRPRGATQREVVGRIVNLSWRLRRLARAEETLWDGEDARRVTEHEQSKHLRTMFDLPDVVWGSNGEEPPPATGAQFVAWQFRKYKPSPLERMAVYEQRLDRALHAAMRQLEQLKKMQQDDEADDEAADEAAEAEGAAAGEAAAADDIDRNMPVPVAAGRNHPAPNEATGPGTPGDAAGVADAGARNAVARNEPTADPADDGATMTDDGSADPAAEQAATGGVTTISPIRQNEPTAVPPDAGEPSSWLNAEVSHRWGTNTHR